MKLRKKSVALLFMVMEMINWKMSIVVQKEQYLYMTLLDLSVRLIQSERRNDTEPYESVMNNLTAEILATLGDKS